MESSEADESLSYCISNRASVILNNMLNIALIGVLACLRCLRDMNFRKQCQVSFVND